MVLQKTLDSLRERPYEDKRAVATVVSLVVVVLLILVWSYFFFRSVQTADMGDLPGQTAAAAATFQ